MDMKTELMVRETYRLIIHKIRGMHEKMRIALKMERSVKLESFG